jgi:DNA replication protein DnaC
MIPATIEAAARRLGALSVQVRHSLIKHALAGKLALMVRIFVAVTDWNWFDFLSAMQPDEVNFWAPTGRKNFRSLQPGELFLFKLHAPNNFIVGGGVFSHASNLPLSLAWEAFGTKNGAADMAEMRQRVGHYRADEPRTIERFDPTIGCRILARRCAAEGVDYFRYLARLVELELIDRELRMLERRIRAAKFPAAKSLDSFDFAAVPKLNKMLVLERARCEWIERRENGIALGPSGTGKTHVAIGLGLAACQKGLSVGFTTAAALVSEMMEARDERRLLRFQKQMAGYKLLIIDELGFVLLSKIGVELLFELISQRYERGSTVITSNLPFKEWTEIFGSERLTGALLNRLTHQVSILEMNGDSYRLAQSRARKASRTPEKLPRAWCRTSLGLRPPGARYHAHQLAWFCVAQWPIFAPPLTKWASLSRTATSRASMAACATNA